MGLTSPWTEPRARNLASAWLGETGPYLTLHYNNGQTAMQMWADDVLGLWVAFFDQEGKRGLSLQLDKIFGTTVEGRDGKVLLKDPGIVP
jgi:hypothetical protein